jgi:hypothetical protein
MTALTLDRFEAAASHAADAARDELVRAINRACAARGDSDAERESLIAESLAMPPELHHDLAQHFLDQERLFTVRSAL